MAIPGRPTWRSDLRSDIAANDFSRELYSGPESVFQTILARVLRASSTFFRSYNYLGEALLNPKIVEHLETIHRHDRIEYLDPLDAPANDLVL